MNKVNGKIDITAFCGCFLLWITILAGAVVRTLQLFYAIDFRTGFYNAHYTVPLLQIVLWVGCVLTIAVIALCKRHPFQSLLEERKSNLLTITYALVAVLCGVQAIGYGVATLLTKMVAGVTGVETFDIIIAALLLLSVISFILLARGNHKGRSIGLFAVLPTLFCGAKLMDIFMEHTTIANISVYLFEVLFYAAATIFLLSVAKTAINTGKVGGDIMTVLSGVLTAVFGALIVLPDYTVIIISTFFANTGELASYVQPPTLDVIGFTLLAVVYLGVVLKYNVKSEAA